MHEQGITIPQLRGTHLVEYEFLTKFLTVCMNLNGESSLFDSCINTMDGLLYLPIWRDLCKLFRKASHA